MFHVFKKYIDNKLHVTDAQFEQLKDCLTPKTLRKGEILLQAGDICKYAAFVEHGCLRSYVIDPKGKEHVIQFAPENWWVSEQNSVQRKVPAIFYIDAVEDSEILLTKGDPVESFSTVVPAVGQMFNQLKQNSMYAMQKRLVNHLSATADERYLDFLNTYPSLALRLPQKMIAAYIGVAPESLSRIRNHISVKKV